MSLMAWSDDPLEEGMHHARIAAVCEKRTHVCINSAFAPHSGLPFVPHPVPDELLGSWLLRVT